MKLNFWIYVFILGRIRRIFLYLTLEFSATLAFNCFLYREFYNAAAAEEWQAKTLWRVVDRNVVILVTIILPEQCVEFIGMKPVKHSHLGRWLVLSTHNCSHPAFRLLHGAEAKSRNIRRIKQCCRSFWNSIFQNLNLSLWDMVYWVLSPTIELVRDLNNEGVTIIVWQFGIVA